MTALRVLVTEDVRGAADEAVAELEQAGHTVLRCCEPTGAAFPCAALRDGSRCPLDAQIDVALAVRRHSHPRPTRREVGVSCALKARVPLVVAGHGGCDPFAQWESEFLPRTHQIVEACERVARAPLWEHGRRADRAIREVLRTHGYRGVSAPVTVQRLDGRLVVHVRATKEIPKQLHGMISVRIVAALRDHDRDAAGIDVAITDEGAPG
jgi:hypothetical protein